MLSHDGMPRLSRVLALRTVLVTVAISCLLLAFFFTKYMLDTPTLRHTTLQNEAREIIAALRTGHDPSRLRHYRSYPDAYAFRVFDRRAPNTRKLIAQVNAHLFLTLPELGTQSAPDAEPQITEGFSTIADPDGRANADRWLLTDHEDVGNRSYWLQIVMVGDPAWRWQPVITDEMIDHVLLPVLSIVPPLAFAIWLTTHLALRPLDRIASQAAALGAAVGAGGTLTPLAAEHLPLEFHRVVTAINAMLGRIERTLSLQTQFTADAAHELRTPLAVLLLQLDELPDSPPVQNIRNELRGLGLLVDQLLQFAQAENTATQQREPVDIASIARAVGEELASTALARNLMIEFDAPDHLMPLLGYPALIETAIRNTVVNAIRYAPPGTSVALGVDPASRVTVEDRGPGVPDAYKELIFNRFWRADRRTGTGAGIGLALVRRIAELHGGTALVEDREGGGARFVVTFAATGEG